MAIPDYQSIMLPLLQFAGDRQEHPLRNSIENLADLFDLNDAERKELLPSGRQATFDNRVGWARTYLKKAGLLKSTRRGYFQITERGTSVLANAPARIDNKFLKQFPEFIEFQNRKKVLDSSDENETDKTNPEELIEDSYQKLREGLAGELLDTIKNSPPSFFEQLVVDLLVAMGYGGTRKDAGEALGRSGDGGIDGIIKEDRLGLDIV